MRTANSNAKPTPWMMADYRITLQQSSSRVDVKKTVKGVSHVDLFLCSNAQCAEVADMQYMSQQSVMGTAVSGAKQGILGYRFNRINETVVGIPLAHTDNATVVYSATCPSFDASDILAAHSSNVSSKRGEEKCKGSPDRLSIEEMHYEAPEWLEVLHETPLMVPVGEWARAHSKDVSSLRVGTYYASNFPSGEQCITIITPNHAWMDAHGWDKAHDCGESSGVYILSSYFPQAFFLDNEATVAHCAETVQLPDGRTFSGAGCLDLYLEGGLSEPHNLSTSYTEVVNAWNEKFLPLKPPGHAKDISLQSYGRRLAFDKWSKENRLTGAQSYATTMNEPMHCVSENMCILAVVGTAPVLLMKLTDSSKPFTSTAMPTPTKRHNVTSEAFTWYDNGGDGRHPGLQVSSGETLLLGLVRLSELGADQLPWCMRDTKFEWHLTAPAGTPFVTAENGSYVAALDCSMWDRLGLGYADASYPQQKLTQTTTLTNFMTPAWVSLGGAFPNGFAGRERLTQGTVDEAVRTIVLIAARQLNSAVSLQLSVTDSTISSRGGAILLSTLLVSVIAVSVSHADMESTMVDWAGKCGCDKSSQRLIVACRVCVALTAAFTILFPVVMALVGEIAAHENNTYLPTVTWLQVPATGYGDYHVLAAVSRSFEADYDDFGYTLLWVAVVLAAVATVAVWVAIFTTMHKLLQRAGQWLHCP
jgi:hypothetical protein